MFPEGEWPLQFTVSAIPWFILQLKVSCYRLSRLVCELDKSHSITRLAFIAGQSVVGLKFDTQKLAKDRAHRFFSGFICVKYSRRLNEKVSGSYDNLFVDGRVAYFAYAISDLREYRFVYANSWTAPLEGPAVVNWMLFLLQPKFVGRFGHCGRRKGTARFQHSSMMNYRSQKKVHRMLLTREKIKYLARLVAQIRLSVDASLGDELDI